MAFPTLQQAEAVSLEAAEKGKHQSAEFADAMSCIKIIILSHLSESCDEFQMATMGAVLRV